MKLKQLVAFAFIMIFVSCTMPPPPCVVCNGEKLPVVAYDFGFAYRLCNINRNLLLYCRKKYEDQIYGF